MCDEGAHLAVEALVGSSYERSMTRPIAVVLLVVAAFWIVLT